MNKVLQAAGRVIRTAEDVGIIVLLDDRFQQYSYRRLFPREWEQVQPVTVDTVAKRWSASGMPGCGKRDDFQCDTRVDIRYDNPHNHI